jgi:ubiquinone biosynthesis protein UbiJ
MATQSPLSFLADAFGQATSAFKLPDWMVGEAQHRLVLLLNHVLMQEPEAQARLARQKGQIVRVQWRGFEMQLAATPAGLCELTPSGKPDLMLTVVEASPVALARQALEGQKPEVRIEGDVQLAADINWLVDHVRWDTEEDLARLIGDAPAHALAQAGRRVAQSLRAFVTQRPRNDKAPS